MSMIDVAVEASAPRVYWRVALASASSGGGEGLPKVSCLVASSLGHLRSQCSIVCGSSLQRGTVGLRKGFFDWRKLSAAKCDRLEET